MGEWQAQNQTSLDDFLAFNAHLLLCALVAPRLQLPGQAISQPMFEGASVMIYPSVQTKNLSLIIAFFLFCMLFFYLAR
jgi:hypothetical protein